MKKLLTFIFILFLVPFSYSQNVSPRVRIDNFVVQAVSSTDTLFTLAADADSSTKVYRCWPDMSFLVNVEAPNDSTVNFVFDFKVAPLRDGEGKDDATQFTSVFRDTIDTEGTIVEIVRIDGAVTPIRGASGIVPAASVPGPPWVWMVTLDGTATNALDSTDVSLVFQGAASGIKN